MFDRGWLKLFSSNQYDWLKRGRTEQGSSTYAIRQRLTSEKYPLRVEERRYYRKGKLRHSKEWNCWETVGVFTSMMEDILLSQCFFFVFTSHHPWWKIKLRILLSQYSLVKSLDKYLSDLRFKDNFSYLLSKSLCPFPGSSSIVRKVWTPFVHPSILLMLVACFKIFSVRFFAL